MLPEFGGAEMLVIAALALIIIGPKELPVMLRKFGKFVGKMRAMAQEFRSSFDELARQSELDDLRKEIEAMRLAQSYDPSGLVPGPYGVQPGVEPAPPPSYEATTEAAVEPAAKPRKPRKPAAKAEPKPAKATKATAKAPAKAPAAKPAAARARKKAAT